ncbi:MAG TPA: glycosyltransferase [Syntrophorhabdales bacterium]|nr:glycosyltransferase [Syntrophorhabdales bacterium]
MLERELDRLVPPSQPRVVCYDSPSQYYLAKELHDDISVYVAIDDRTLRVTGVPIKGEIEAEKKLLQRVDKIVCVSETLAETLSSRIPSSHTKPVHVLSNGYDERMFDPQQNYSEPEILKRIPRPRVLVAGHVSNRIDWEGIRRASVLRPQWTWVFLGPTDPGMEEIISHDLREHRFWHPQVPLVNVPAWIRHCDACAVPYRLNAFTRASSPLKAIEYLAMGAFLLSTRVPALEQYKDVTSWVEEGNGATYASALDKAISQASDPLHVAASILAVRNDSWEKKAEQFKEIVFGIQPSLTSASQARAVISCN